MRGTRTDARRRRHFRVRKSVHGTPARPRLAVFRSNKHIYAQIIDDESGRTIVSASSKESAVKGESLTVDTATEVGVLVGARAQDAGVSRVVFDRGGFKYHGRIKALAEAARKTGLEF
ncbi:MAG: 50S ribosomal protein L18 [Actinomycetota bacterium]|nr:50S ribosomal protein L18 [Actinomycetota bacterium]MDK1016279.1 50S ribosomal protein L18 [Actinomycetota bacterium]MDK1026035.1 50S ribosomal protein L18 [Actinomycetota bacterium]MDK1037853.1 50S ribosomal protein L18 [Actinomycetota bacterium]MDK1096870.1 50S ribosomal protein L18 [Actinomycetota bacterium]